MKTWIIINIVKEKERWTVIKAVNRLYSGTSVIGEREFSIVLGSVSNTERTVRNVQ